MGNLSSKKDQSPIFLQILALGVRDYLHLQDCTKIYCFNEICKRTLGNILFNARVPYISKSQIYLSRRQGIKIADIEANMGTFYVSHCNPSPRTIDLLVKLQTLVLHVDCLEQYMEYCSSVTRILARTTLTLSRIHGKVYSKVKKLSLSLNAGALIAESFPNLIFLNLVYTGPNDIATELQVTLPSSLIRLELSEFRLEHFPEFLQELDIKDLSMKLRILPQLPLSLKKLRLWGNVKYDCEWPNLQRTQLRGLFNFKHRLPNMHTFKFYLESSNEKLKHSQILMPIRTKYFVLQLGGPNFIVPNLEEISSEIFVIQAAFNLEVQICRLNKIKNSTLQIFNTKNRQPNMECLNIQTDHIMFTYINSGSRSFSLGAGQKIWVNLPTSMPNLKVQVLEVEHF
jgi:hypothetical protein